MQTSLGSRVAELGRGLRAGVPWLLTLLVGAARSVAGAAVAAFALPPPARRWPLRTRGGWTGRPRDVVWVLDVVAAVAVTAASAAAYEDRIDVVGQAAEVLGPGTAVLAGAATALPLVLRDRWPVAAWRVSGAVAVGSALWLAPVFEAMPLFPSHLLVLLVTSYTAVVRADRAIALGLWALTMAGLAFMVVPAQQGAPALDPQGWSALALVLSVPVVFGHNVRARRQTQVALLDERRGAELARAERAVLEERSRIARDLHDVVAHHMTLIAIQAEAAPLRSPDDPRALRDGLASIRAMALTVLTETRRILGVLRDDRRVGVEPPAPGLADVRALVDAAREAGHTVTLELQDDVVDVSPGTALSVYRIVQESLSNVLQHASGAAVAVAVRHVFGPPPRLEVDVTNGPATAPPRTAPAGDGGHGLIGMRERVAMLDGRLRTGATADGGYAVHITLPAGGP